MPVPMDNPGMGDDPSMRRQQGEKWIYPLTIMNAFPLFGAAKFELPVLTKFFVNECADARPTFMQLIKNFMNNIDFCQ